MLKKLFAAAALLLSVQANATLITVDLDQASYNVGDTIKASLVLTEIQALVTGFDASLLFNQSLVELTEIKFGDFLSLPAVGSDQGDIRSAGKVDLYELFFGFSNEDIFDLSQVQANSPFVLATVSFKALKAGASEFALGGLSVMYLPEDGPEYSDNETRGRSATAQISGPASVPAPATLLLLLPALLLLRRRQH